MYALIPVLLVIIGAAYKFGHDMGSNKFDKDKNDLFLDYTKSQDENKRLNDRVLEDSVIYTSEIRRLENTNRFLDSVVHARKLN